MKRVNVTKSFMPPLEEYQAYLQQIWDKVWLTNQGPLLQEFERRAGEYLGVKRFHFVSNGTTALQIALRALDIEDGEIITTPFTYVATTSAIMWERCTPVYVDIDPETLNIDPDKIEAAITPRTRAIMPVHVFGNPCDVQRIEQIAKKHNLKVIYDAAHAFGVTYNGRSLLDYGDVSTCSFHATKPFHTVEGGAVFTPYDNISQKLELIKRFGHENDDHYMLGINAKATELQAAMGLCNLKYIDSIFASRKKVSEWYDANIRADFPRQTRKYEGTHNYAYYPIIMPSKEELLRVLSTLKTQNIHPRRYFFPSLNKLPYLKGKQQSCPVSEDIAERIMCLPLYGDLEEGAMQRIEKAVNLV